MSAEILRRAADAIRTDCPIPDGSRGMDFIDFPTGWAMQNANEVAHDGRCSATQTSGAMLCDCEALLPMWVRWMTLLAVAEWLEQVADTHDDPYYRENYDDLIRPALAVARAYLGEAADA